MVRKLSLLVLALVLVLPLAVPVAAQEDEVTIRISQEELQSVFGDYVAAGFIIEGGFGDPRGSVSLRDMEIVLDVTFNVDASSPLLEGVQDATTLEQPFALQVIMTPSVVNTTTGTVDYLRFSVVDASLSDAIGTPIELPQPRMAGLVRAFAASWHQAITHIMRDHVLAEYPDGLPGRPQIANVSVNGIFLQIDLFFTATRADDTGELVDPFADLIPVGAELTPNQDGTASLIITQEQMNRAFAAMAANHDQVNSLSVVFDDGNVRFMMTTNALCNNEVIEATYAYTAPDATETSLYWWRTTVASLTCAGEPLEPSEARLGNFEIQDLMSRAFMRVIRTAAGENQIIAVELDAGRKVVVHITFNDDILP